MRIERKWKERGLVTRQIIRSKYRVTYYCKETKEIEYLEATVYDAGTEGEVKKAIQGYLNHKDTLLGYKEIQRDALLYGMDKESFINNGTILRTINISLGGN